MAQLCTTSFVARLCDCQQNWGIIIELGETRALHIIIGISEDTPVYHIYGIIVTEICLVITYHIIFIELHTHDK